MESENVFTLGSILGTILYFLALLLGLWILYQHKPRLPKALIWVVLAVGAALRLFLMQKYPGYASDMSCFYSWGVRMAENGPTNFYAADYFCDYPPGYLYLLWFSGKITTLFNIGLESGLGRIVVKLVPFLFDLACIFAIWKIAEKLMDNTTALVLAVFYALSPAILINGAIWGQADSVVAFGLLLTVFAVIKGKWQIALPLYLLTVLIKPQALMVGPLGLTALLADMFPWKSRGKANLLRAAIGLGVGLGISALLLYPFLLGQAAPISWLVEKYAGTMSYYQYATVNALNLHYILGGNWVSLTEGGAYWVFGLFLTAVAVAVPVVIYLVRRDKRLLPLMGALTFILLFLFGVQMHERYIFPAFILLVLAFALRPDWRIPAVLCGFGITYFINCAYVLQNTHLPLGFDLSGSMLAVANLLLGGIALWVALDKKQAPLPQYIAPKNGGPSPLERHRLNEKLNGKTPPLGIRLADIGIMAALCAIYSVLAFYNLGSLSAPQTVWKTQTDGETLLIELPADGPYDVLFYCEINWSDTPFTLEFSADGENFEAPLELTASPGDCFKWQYAIQGASGRYVRITAPQAGLALMELAFRDAQSGQVLTPVIPAGSEALFDEAHTVPDEPSFYNGTYFDEIYHARTAYEHANGLPTYETTHPPLGKIFIMLGIKLFGMTPFGWRFAGTLAGVLMLPAMYLLGFVVFKKRKWALICSLLMALDIMHFTQTRIATIDSFAVLFIILMYACMLRYTQMSFYRDGWRTLVPLGASGIFMGLGIASKWICFYAAAGLAAIFFHNLYVRWRERKLALALGGNFSRRTRDFSFYSLCTIAFCLIFFLAIPFTIYYLSYIPHLASSGGLNATSFWQAQVSMFSYHANLTARHSYESPWYEWPLSLRPIWFYSSAYQPEGMVSSINSFGNIVVWWGGLGCLCALLYLWARPYLGGPRLGKNGACAIPPSYILVGFAAQFVPWIFISRATFIYHYFASVVFIILAIVFCFSLLQSKIGRWANLVLAGFLVLAAGMFALHYPLASGLSVSRSYANAVNFLSWLKLPNWDFGGWLRY